jgi:hypothetical protein
MNAAQLAEIQRQANGDPARMVELIVDHHLANTYGGNVNAYVDALGRNVDNMQEAQTVMGVLPFLAELESRGAAQANLDAVIEKMRTKLKSFAPPPKQATGARRRAKTGRRGKKGTRRGRRGHF